MGARAVFVARPILWGLAYDGENGVKGVLELFRSEFKMAMALSGSLDKPPVSFPMNTSGFVLNLHTSMSPQLGCVKVSDLHPGMIRPVASFYTSKL